MLGIFLTVWANKIKGGDLLQKKQVRKGTGCKGKSLGAPGTEDITGIHHMLNSLSFIRNNQLL